MDYTVTKCTKQEQWDKHAKLHGAYPLQLWGWGEVKRHHGWQATRLLVEADGAVIGGAQILERRIPKIGRTIAYVPRGPFCDEANRDATLDAITRYCKNNIKSIVLTIEPAWKDYRPSKPWRHSSNNILIAKTVLLDLNKTEDELMAGVSSKRRRQDIRRSSKLIDTIRPIRGDEELERCLVMHHETAKRSNFALHDDGYYRTIYQEMGDNSQVIGAFDKNGKMLAFIWYAVSKDYSFQLYSSINEAGRSIRANFGLRWWGIMHMKAAGVRWYDFNGLLPGGVDTFKRSFASHEDDFIGTYDYPLSRLYWLWRWGLPLGKKMYRILARK